MNMRSNTQHHPGHEHGDINGRAVVLAALGVLMGIGLVALAAAGFARMESREHLGAIESNAPRIVQLRSDLRSEREDYNASKQVSLTSYAWIDRERRIAQVPIERAMELIVEQKNPAGSRQ